MTGSSFEDIRNFVFLVIKQFHIYIYIYIYSEEKIKMKENTSDDRFDF
jgi:hypothetical protein